MRIGNWLVALVVAVLIGVGLAVWRPWYTPPPRSGPWTAMVAAHPRLAREPLWMVPQYRVTGVLFEKEPPGIGLITAFYQRGTGKSVSRITVLEAADNTKSVAPNMRTIHKDGLAMQVAQWDKSTQAGFDQDGIYYTVVGTNGVPLGDVERIALSLRHR